MNKTDRLFARAREMIICPRYFYGNLLLASRSLSALYARGLLQLFCFFLVLWYALMFRLHLSLISSVFFVIVQQ